MLHPDHWLITRRFRVYDAQSHSHARYFLPSRMIAATSNSSRPGSPGRWALPADMSGFEAMARMLGRSKLMADMFVSFSCLTLS